LLVVDFSATFRFKSATSTFHLMREHLKETEATKRFEKRHDRAFKNKAVFAYSARLKARAQ